MPKHLLHPLSPTTNAYCLSLWCYFITYIICIFDCSNKLPYPVLIQSLIALPSPVMAIFRLNMFLQSGVSHCNRR